MHLKNIALIGAGNMARALIGGLRTAGFDAQCIRVADPMAEPLVRMAADFGVVTTRDNRVAIDGAQLIILAVKPQEMIRVLRELKPAICARQPQAAISAQGPQPTICVQQPQSSISAQQSQASISTQQPLLLSVAAGIRTATLTGELDGYPRVVRAMPNRPALLGQGITALYAPSAVTPSERGAVAQVLHSVGKVVWLEDEQQMDAVTAVSGSGPAYFFLLIELLEDAARSLGLSAEIARTLSIETAYGAVYMAHAPGASDPGQLRAEVTSPGGTTAAALAVMEKSDLRGIVRAAVAAACQRSAELAQAVTSN